MNSEGASWLPVCPVGRGRNAKLQANSGENPAQLLPSAALASPLTSLGLSFLVQNRRALSDSQGGCED